MTNVLFICSGNKHRSQRAEEIFREYPGISCDSAGLSENAENPLTHDQVEWADLILVMENRQQGMLRKNFPKQLMRGKKVACLNIRDRFDYDDHELVDLLEQRVTRALSTLKHHR